MHWPRARDELLLRHYAWSLRQWDAERAHNFATLRSMRARAADHFLAALQKLPPDKVSLATVALTKRAHSQAVTLIGQNLNARENAVLADLDTYRHMWTNNNPSEKGIAIAARHDAAPRIKDLLAGLGTPEQIGSLEWRYNVDVGGWSLQTYIDFGGRYGDLSYGHSLQVNSNWTIPGRISFLSSLGIANSKWRIRDESDADAAANRIASLARDFIQAVAELTSGLTVES